MKRRRVNLGGIEMFARRRYSLRRVWYFRTRYSPNPLLHEDYTCQFPVDAVVETGNVCNLRCPGCPTGSGRRMRKGVMSYADFRVVFKKIMHSTIQLHLFNFGEPFLNRDILRMIGLSSRYGLRTHLDSNLTAREFSAQEAEAIVGSGLTRLVASIDGASQETYERYRVGGSFEWALGNLEAIQRARLRLGSDTPMLEWQFLVNAVNEHEMDRARAMARDMGVKIFFKPMHTSDESLMVRHHHPEQVGQQAVCEQRTETRRTRPARVGNLAAAPPLYEWCLQPFRMLIVNVDGNVYPCCNVYGDEYSLGNIHEESLEQIWNGDKARKCREFIYNFGGRQHTGSICETLPCPLEQKYIV